MRIVALVPARAGSKGVPNKNLVPLGGFPLLEWTIRASLLTPQISRTIVSTDSDHYANVAKSLGAEVPFLRPSEFAQDNSSDTQFVLHALNFLDDQGYYPDYFVHLRPTTPFRDPKVVEQAIELFVTLAATHTSLRSVHLMSESAYKTMEIDRNGLLMASFSHEYDLEPSNGARQNFPTTYTPNGYVDVLSCDYIRTSGNIHGNRVKAYMTETVIELDTLEELSILELQLKLNLEPLERLFSNHVF